MERGVLQVQVDAIHVLGENGWNVDRDKGSFFVSKERSDGSLYMINKGRAKGGSLFLHLETASTSSHGTYPWGSDHIFLILDARAQ